MEPRKLTMEDLVDMDLSNPDMELLRYNGFSGEYQDDPAKPGQIRVACVGDSITYGHGIYRWPEENYPRMLEKWLGEGFHVRNFGICGRCVQDDADQPYRNETRYRESLEYHADIVVLMMGTNDSKPRNWRGGEAFRRGLEALLADYRREAGKPEIFLCTPATAFFAEGFDGPVTKFDVQPGIVDHITGIVEETAEAHGCPLIDIHTLTAAHPEWFAADSVHPDNSGAAVIARKVYEEIQKEREK